MLKDNKKKNPVFILDVDGVLNTGQFLYSEAGKVFKVFGPHDNDGLKLLKGKIKIIFFTADKRGFQITKKRITEDMGFRVELISEADRYEHINNNYDIKNVIYMGDGYHDSKILEDCVLGIAPANARKEAKKSANFTTESRAGEGAVLDACLEIIKTFPNIFREK